MCFCIFIFSCSVVHSQLNYYVIRDTIHAQYEYRGSTKEGMIDKNTQFVRISNIETPRSIETIPLSKIKAINRVDEDIKFIETKGIKINVISVCACILGALYCYDKIDDSRMVSRKISQIESDQVALEIYYAQFSWPPPTPQNVSDLKRQKTKDIAIAIVSGLISVLGITNIVESQTIRVDLPKGKLVYQIDF